MKFCTALVALVAAALVQPALAQPGKGHGNDNAPGQGQGQGVGQGQGQGQGPGYGQAGGRGQATATPGNIAIADRDRSTVYSYYRNQYAAGNCPPGLAKKNNGCLPPGQVNKAWAIGQPLPGSVVYYALPGALLSQLTPAPAGYQYVQVASDILMMAIGTRMIVGALADLSTM